MIVFSTGQSSIPIIEISGITLMSRFWSKVDRALFPHDFTHINEMPQRCFKPLTYTFFRIIMFLAMLTIFTYVAYFFHSKDILYFTTWGLILALLCQLVMCLENVLNWKLRGKTKLRYWKVSHFIFTVSLVFQMFITGVYWGGLFPYAVMNLWGTMGLYDILNPIMAHAAPVILLLIDFQFNLVVIWNSAYIIPYYLLLGVYLIVNMTYTLEKNTIYDLIDYRTWQSYLFLIACGIVILICHFLARLISKYCKEKSILSMLGDEQENTILNPMNQSGGVNKDLLGNVTKEIELVGMGVEREEKVEENNFN